MNSRNDSDPPRNMAHPVQARTLGFLLREVYGSLQDQIYAAVAAAGHPGLRATHSPVLRHLPPSGGRVADVARATGLAKQSVTYVIDDLIALGYVRSGPDPDDGRARRISYTPRGRTLVAALADASRNAELSLASTLGEARLKVMRESLEMILEHARAPIDGSSAPDTRRRVSGVS